MEDTVALNGFIKIGQPIHIQSLRNEGLIHCKTVKYFRDLEADELARRDNREGAESSTKIHGFELKFPKLAQNIPLKFTKVHLHTFDRRIDSTHLFCLLALRPEQASGKPFIDQRNIKFGEQLLLIHDAGEFANRFQKAADGKIKYTQGLVRYYDENENHTNLTIYDKPNHFEYQNEWRFHIEEVGIEPIELRIGSIADISMILNANQLTELTMEPIKD